MQETKEIVTVVVLLSEKPLSRSEAGPLIARYVTQLDLRATEPFLLSVVYLTGGRPGVNLETVAICQLFGIDIVRIYYTSLGLQGLRADYFADHPIPLAWALAPYLAPIGNPKALRARCRDRISAASELDESRRALLLRSVVSIDEL